MIGQTKYKAFLKEWELAYHELLGIGKCHNDITASLLTTSDAVVFHHELIKRSVAEYNESVDKVIKLMNENNSHITLRHDNL